MKIFRTWNRLFVMLGIGYRVCGEECDVDVKAKPGPWCWMACTTDQ